MFEPLDIFPICILTKCNYFLYTKGHEMSVFLNYSRYITLVCFRATIITLTCLKSHGMSSRIKSFIWFVTLMGKRWGSFTNCYYNFKKCHSPALNWLCFCWWLFKYMQSATNACDPTSGLFPWSNVSFVGKTETWLVLQYACGKFLLWPFHIMAKRRKSYFS